MDVQVGDVLQMKKPHPCGSSEFVALRVGMDFRIRCTKCGREVMIGAYGHDDRVCAYTALRAEIGAQAPQYTTVLCLADKEEIGSQGNTGLNADYLLHYLTYLAEGQGTEVKGVLAASKCLSADVSAALDPTFEDVFEKNNAARLNHGYGFSA